MEGLEDARTAFDAGCQRRDKRLEWSDSSTPPRPPAAHPRAVLGGQNPALCQCFSVISLVFLPSSVHLIVRISRSVASILSFLPHLALSLCPLRA